MREKESIKEKLQKHMFTGAAKFSKLYTLFCVGFLLDKVDSFSCL